MLYNLLCVTKIAKYVKFQWLVQNKSVSERAHAIICHEVPVWAHAASFSVVVGAVVVFSSWPLQHYDNMLPAKGDYLFDKKQNVEIV